MTKRERLDQLNASMSVCSNCALHCGASHVVPGDGNPDAQIMFIGEAPGKNEDLQGIPFVGSSGKILEKMFESIKLKREDVYLTNICKCRPPENRDPLPEEIAACLPWLEKQIQIIDPKIIVTLGKFALTSLLPTAKISELHGKILEVDFKKIGKKKILSIYHPAAARCNRKTKALFEADFQKIPQILVQLKKEQ